MAGTCAVFEVSSENKETVLLRFANGKVRKNVREPDLKMRCFYSDATEDGVKRKRINKILVAENKKVQYTGYNFGYNAPKTSGICRFHIGIHNKLSGTVNVLPSSIFSMKPLFSHDEKLDIVDNISNKEKRDKLTSAFGSKKKHRAVELRENQYVQEESLQTSVSTIIKESKIEKILSGISTVANELSQPESIPPRNDLAKHPEDVYDLNSIINQEEYSTLLGFAEELCSADKATVEQWRTDSKFPNYVLSWLPRLTFGSSNKTKTAVLLIYFSYLIQLLSLRYNDLRKKDPLPDVPEPVKSSLLEKFTVRSGQGPRAGRSIPPRLKDKIMAYAVVVALHIENFVLHLESVRLDFKVAQNRICTICNALGCHVSSRKTPEGIQTKVIELKIPLFVMNEKGARRGKKK